MTAVIPLAVSAVQAVGAIQKGRTQAAQFEGQARSLEVQAQFTRFNAKQQSLKDKARAVQELEKTLQTLASINAAAGAGNVDPFSGNAFGLKTRALDVGGTNFALADNNRAITQLLGEQQANLQLFQASQARAAGKAAKRAGLTSALFSIGGGVFNFAQTFVPGPSLITPAAAAPSGGANLFGGFGNTNAFLPGGPANSFSRFTF
jgi:hypothetical protein